MVIRKLFFLVLFLASTKSALCQMEGFPEKIGDPDARPAHIVNQIVFSRDHLWRRLIPHIDRLPILRHTNELFVDDLSHLQRKIRRHLNQDGSDILIRLRSARKRNEFLEFNALVGNKRSVLERVKFKYDGAYIIKCVFYDKHKQRVEHSFDFGRSSSNVVYEISLYYKGFNSGYQRVMEGDQLTDESKKRLEICSVMALGLAKAVFDE